MNYEKIGTFIKEKRKELNLTQKELASKLGITDKAISKWERGLGFPDVSLLEDLSTTLNISILELIKGEAIDNDINIETENYIKETLSITENEHLRKRKELINKIFSFIIIGISIIILILNLFQVINLNKTYTHTINPHDKVILQNKLDEIEFKYQIINNNKGKYSDNDYKLIMLYLEEIINNFKKEDLFTKDTITYKTLDIYMLEYTKKNRFGNNTRVNNILNILTNYNNTELFNSYRILYNRITENLTSNDINYNYSLSNIAKYKILNTNDYFSDNNYITIQEKYIEYQICNIIFLENLIMKVGGINE